MIKICRIHCFFAVLVLTLSTLFASMAFANGKTKIKAKGNFDFTKTSAIMREMETRPDFPVSGGLANDYVYSLLALGEKIEHARKAAIITYIKNAQQKNGGFIMDKANRNASLLSTDIALETLGYLNATSYVDAGKVRLFVASLKNSDGGFGFSKESKGSSLATTFYAVRILKAIGGLDLIDKAKTAAYVKGFEKKDGGFSFVKGPGISDCRNTYMAAYVLNRLGTMDVATRKNAVRFLATTPYAGKKSKDLLELNEQLYAVEALKELKAADLIDKKEAMTFLNSLYIKVNGGFGPLVGYGTTPDSTTTALRILAEIGKLKVPKPHALADKKLLPTGIFHRI